MRWPHVITNLMHMSLGERQEMVMDRVQFLGQEDSLEKEMATHSSILAWKSPGQRSLVGYSPRIAKSRT